jgi:transcriptional regulator of met regulon
MALWRFAEVSIGIAVAVVLTGERSRTSEQNLRSCTKKF